MKRTGTLLCVITLLIALNAYAADSTCTASQNDLYPYVLLGINTAIRFKKAEDSVAPDGDIYPITVVEQQCDTGSEKQVAELPYLGDPGKVESAFLEDADFDGISELFVIHRSTLTRIPVQATAPITSRLWYTGAGLQKNTSWTSVSATISVQVRIFCRHKLTTTSYTNILTSPKHR